MTARKKTSKLSQIRKASKTGKLTPGFITVLGTRKQTGKSIERADKQHKALQPGYRISKSGRLYYEARENRSDTPAQITAYTKSHAKTAAKPKKTTAKKTTAKKAAAKTVKAIPAPVIKATRKLEKSHKKYNWHYYDDDVDYEALIHAIKEWRKIALARREANKIYNFRSISKY